MSLALASAASLAARRVLCKELLDRVAGAARCCLRCRRCCSCIAVLVAVTSPGPVLHRRRVVGRNGIEFDAFKLRTMVVDADAILRAPARAAARVRAPT